MNDLSNPLFDNQREFLERQKEEYKNALMGDVDHIKSQGQDIGKKAAIAGGVLFAGYLVKRMFSGGKKKVKKNKKEVSEHSYTQPGGENFADYDSYVHEQEDNYTLSSERMPHAHTEDTIKHTETTKSNKKNNSFLHSGLGKVLTTQAVTLLLVFAGKKLEEYLNSVSENDDIAEKPLVVTEIETTEIIVPEKDAL
jgi:hypothetical protein